MPKSFCRDIATFALAVLPLTSLAQAWQPPPRPSTGLMPNPVVGKPLYETHCAACHGIDLKGSEAGPPMLHKIYEPSHHSDAAFQIAAAQGVRAHHWKFGDMAPVPGLTPDDVAHITAYIRMHQRRVGIR
ncbi:MAG: c-type cytochrome [Rhodocyclaceae bacterium]|nr:c-type cytochrome [Rhodocyclaceae bacterium]